MFPVMFPPDSPTLAELSALERSVRPLFITVNVLPVATESVLPGPTTVWSMVMSDDTTTECPRRMVMLFDAIVGITEAGTHVILSADDSQVERLFQLPVIIER